MGMIERRRSLAAVGALLVMPLLASAQKRRGALQHPARIGLIHDYTDDLLSLLKAALQASGLQEGRDYVLVSSGVGYSESTAEGQGVWSRRRLI